MQNRIITIEEANKIIENQNAVAKIVAADPNSSRTLDFFLNQLANPQTNRPIKNINQRHRHRLFNPRTGDWHYRAVEDKQRGVPKPHKQHTKKTAVTLLPANGKIYHYQPKHGHAVGILFDIEKCDLKNEKYIFANDAATDQKWWLKEKNKTAAQQTATLPRSISLAELKQHLTDQSTQKLIPQWNELLVGLNTNGLVGVFAINDQLPDRIKAIHVQQQIKQKLNIELPIFIITPNGGKQPYDLVRQKMDINKAYSDDVNILPYQFIRNVIEKANLLSKSDEETTQNQQEIIKNFYTSGVIPNDVIKYQLNFLTLLDLITLRNQLSHKKFDSLRKMINEHINNIQLDKLKDTLNTLYGIKSINTKATDFTLFVQDNSEIFANFLNLLSTSSSKRSEYLTQRLTLTSSMIFLFCTNNPKNITLFINAFHNDQDLLNLLFRLIPDCLTNDGHISFGLFQAIIASQNKNLFDQIYSDDLKNTLLLKEIDQRKLFLEKVHQLSHGTRSSFHPNNNYNKAVFTAILQNNDHALDTLIQSAPDQFIKNYLEIKKSAYGVLGTYDEFHTNYSSSFLLENENNSITNLNLLGKMIVALEKNPNLHYQPDRMDKIILTDYFKEKVSHLKTEAEVKQFWQTHKNSRFLNYRRYPLFDTLFFRRDSFMTTSKQALREEAIQKGRRLTSDNTFNLS